MAFYDRILFMWHYVRILCNYEVLCRNKYQGIIFIFANIGNQCLSIKKGYGKER